MIILNKIYIDSIIYSSPEACRSRGAYAPDESNQGWHIPPLNMPLIKFEIVVLPNLFNCFKVEVKSGSKIGKEFLIYIQFT